MLLPCINSKANEIKLIHFTLIIDKHTLTKKENKKINKQNNNNKKISPIYIPSLTY